MSENGLLIAELVLIDTDILIDVGLGIEVARAHLERLEQTTNLAVSAVTQMELIVGCRNKRELGVLFQFLTQFQLVGLSEAVSQTATTLLREYRLSHGLLIPDALIAATAIIQSAPLSSKNQRDYRFVEGLDLLPYP